jgi:aminopeptidase N
LGKALEIDIFPSTDSVTIYYQTSADAEALQWLSAQQTTGKKYPFLFTQSQAILARTWVPCQDSPGIRFSYTATVKVPENLLAVMSANNPTEKNNKGIYQFKMEKAIPAYLLALAVGDITFKSVGNRTGLYAESAIMDKATKEFEDMENMLVAAEKIYGVYDWGRYDMIIMPASFPFGGMENPKLTFATPTIITGDKSLVNLVAHELAHSWSGNLVTNATWEDFWLNEGFTVFFENRIMESLYGKSYSSMLELIALQDLQKEVKTMQAENLADDTKLKLNLTNRNPDDGVTHIAYDKGFFFLRTIEEAVGRQKFDEFVKKYFQTFAYKSVTTEQFVEYLNKNLLDAMPEAKAKINVEKWIYETGLPENYPQISSDRFEYIDKCIAAWLNGTAPNLFKTDDWSSFEWVRFIRNLPADITLAQMKELDKNFKFSSTQNAEIAAVWFALAASKSYEDAYLPMEKFLMQVGRRKFILPIYNALYKNTDTKAKNWATQTYKKARPNYHFVATSTLDKLLGN